MITLRPVEGYGFKLKDILPWVGVAAGAYVVSKKPKVLETLAKPVAQVTEILTQASPAYQPPIYYPPPAPMPVSVAAMPEKVDVKKYLPYLAIGGGVLLLILLIR